MDDDSEIGVVDREEVSLTRTLQDVSLVVRDQYLGEEQDEQISFF